MSTKKIKIEKFLSTVLFFFLLNLQATPFTECPSKAFLFQSNNVQIYGVNLLTGNYSLLEDYVGIDGNINAVGFNFDDRYIYGFNTSSFEVVKVGGDFQATVLPVSGLPADKTFFVGDVADNFYYVYRKNVGFYKINLDDTRENYLQAIEIVGADTSMSLTDFAIHPGDGNLYAVDNSSGLLYRISLDDGSKTALGDTGETGTFGAGYFDVNGYYYVSRNSDGKIFRIDLTDPDNPVAESVLFAQGPFSGQNDGARCAYAPISVENIDWGDAPASYGTLFDDNGPRHELNENIYIGFSVPDGESDGLPFAVNDDSSNQDDEDGIGFVSPIEIGLDSLVQITLTGNGYLNAWMDWNADGDFDDLDEKVFIDVELSSGTHYLSYRVPTHANAASSWARFRYSSATGLTPLGGAPDGEVEDHPIVISQPNVSFRYYPSENGWVTLAYEDIWPLIGDYDMNDVVMHFRVVELLKDGKVIRTDLHGKLIAMGAIFHNGFAVHLEGIARSSVDENRLRVLFNNQLSTTNNLLEQGQTEAVIKVSDDLWSNVNSNCRYYRTELSCSEDFEFSFEISVNFIQPVDLSQMPIAPYNPFIFASEYWGRGELFSETPGRALEIHLADKPVTDLADHSLFGMGDDTSEVSNDRYFRASNNLPWALEVGTEWLHPQERVDLLDAYPLFKSWTESSGVENADWYLPASGNLENVYQ